MFGSPLMRKCVNKLEPDMDGAAHSEFLRRSRSMLASDIGSHRSDIGFVISLPFAVPWDLPGKTYPMPSDRDSE